MVLEESPPLVTLNGVVAISCEWYARNNAMHTFMYRIKSQPWIFRVVFK